MKARIISLLMVAVMVAFTACSDDDNDNDGPSYDNVIKSATDYDPIDLRGAIQSGVTVNLTADKEYLLTGALSVLEGGVLNIEAGTTIKTNVGGADVFIAVHPGATINAKGTAQAPIKITSGATVPRSGDWGGLILAGYAKMNKGETAQSEVAGVTYGGSDDADSSGELSYVICEYTGARISGESEFNGITFYAVGSGTKVDNIVVRYGDDDGVEFFGGTVKCTNVKIVDIKDDMFDWTDGWTGSITNGYGVRTADFLNVTEDPRGFEGDSNSSDNAAAPVSNPTFTNMTIENNSEAVLVDAVKVRRGSNVKIVNCLVTGKGLFNDLVDVMDKKGNATTTASINVSYSLDEDLLGDLVDTKELDSSGNKTGNNLADDYAGIVISEGNTGANTSVFSWAE